MFIFLDDIRDPPPPVRCVSGDAACWTVVRTAEEVWQMILQDGFESIEAISFDNDLGQGKWEGYQLLNKIEQFVAQTKPKRVPDMFVHSANPVARQRMLTIIDRIGQLPLF